MKTAMQELVSEMHEASKYGNNPHIITTINLIIDMAESKFQKEKQQIIDANLAGFDNASRVYPDAKKDAEKYYQSTFKQDQL